MQKAWSFLLISSVELEEDSWTFYIVKFTFLNLVDMRKWCSLLTKLFICNKNVQCGLDDVH